MPPLIFTQYQVKAEPPAQSAQPGQSNAAPWLYSWSEPVRQKINPVLAIALAASGYFGPVLGPSQPGPSNAAPWLYAWSEPVRVKPALRTGDQSVLAFNPLPVVPFGWNEPFSEPVRFKRGLPAQLQQFTAQDTVYSPAVNTLLEGFNWWSEPVRFKPGLKAYLQQSIAHPPRLLPTPNVTMTLAATEANADVFLGAINVYSGGSTTIPGQGAQVSLKEIPIPGNSPVSNKGN